MLLGRRDFWPGFRFSRIIRTVGHLELEIRAPWHRPEHIIEREMSELAATDQPCDNTSDGQCKTWIGFDLLEQADQRIARLFADVEIIPACAGTERQFIPARVCCTGRECDNDRQVKFFRH